MIVNAIYKSPKKIKYSTSHCHSKLNGAIYFLLDYLLSNRV
jgi:hypothetical protein